ncbi:hypothetical protein GX51_04808 [Blastomyces parvus]|uniref:Uncharacterized protein n=1 Tax=Blastomyces parvus TaxID=2060905 RepID=A0A2B7WZJ5_9EURO|nr:hypothetical protein GX51_04808 [Blastomyces parvus]
MRQKKKKQRVSGDAKSVGGVRLAEQSTESTEGRWEQWSEQASTKHGRWSLDWTGLRGDIFSLLSIKIGRSNAAGSAFGENSGSFSLAPIPLEAAGPPGSLGLDREP